MWLKNPGLLPDRIQLGNGPAQRIKLFGQNLRIARLATNDRDETPQWWAPKSVESGASAKVYGGQKVATTAIASSTAQATNPALIHSPSNRRSSHRIGPKGEPEIRPGKNAWNPELLEITMLGFSNETEAEYWAMFLHQQRLAEDYRDALALPLIQHVAELTSKYGLTQDDEPDEPLDRPDDRADAVTEPE